MVNTQQFFGKYDTKVKLVFAILIGLLLIVAAWKIYRYFYPATPPGAEQTQTVNENNLTYLPGDYSIMADTLEAAMVTSGTDEDIIMEVLQQCKNADDLRQLIVTFGTRSNYVFGFTQYTENLIYWLNEETSGTDREDIKAIFNSFSIPF
jgi:hypothetical protein